MSTITVPIDIAKLATVNAVQRRVIYDTLDLDMLKRHEAEEAVRLEIRKHGTSGRREMVGRR